MFIIIIIVVVVDFVVISHIVVEVLVAGTVANQSPEYFFILQTCGCE